MYAHWLKDTCMNTSASADRPAALHDTLDGGAIEALVTGRHGAPFDVLGPHLQTLGDRPAWIVRAFLPGATAAWVAPESGETVTLIPMRVLHPAGLFSAVMPSGWASRYRLQVQRGSADTTSLVDPYALPPVLSDYDLHLMGEGKHFELYDRLGAHARAHDGVQGVAFAVWAPNARRVSVIGDFNGWDERIHPMRMRATGVWELFLPGVAVGALYKYDILSWSHGYRVRKADPFAFEAELRPGTASRVWDLSGYQWDDAGWLAERTRQNAPDAPMSIYELHPGSWRPSSPDGRQVTYRELAHQLVAYLKEVGYTHVELMPIMEHPFDGSWGYQVTGYFAPTSRYGSPQDFMYFVDHCHQNGIGVILDWVPAHFPKDEHGLNYFDGSHLYEHADPRQGEHPDWGTLVFNFGRNEVRNFLIANALFWLERYHVDGLRVDAVASMIYLDYSRKEGEWLPNRYGGRENLEAISFVKECNDIIHARHPDALTIAEESTAWPYVTAPTQDGGLGFSLKWNMGWMHDILEYMHYDPLYRKHHHNELTFSFMYAFSEKFVLALSHDEVVHVKGALLNKMPGDVWQKFANLRALYALMYGHPGKKLIFMGGEFGQWSEWNFAGYLDWFLLDPHSQDGPLHGQLLDLVRDLNRLLRSDPALHELDFAPEGFAWIDGSDTASSVISFVRNARDHSSRLIVVCNFTPVARYNYRIGAPVAGRYAEILNTDAAGYGGSNVGNLGEVMAEPVPLHGHEQSIALTLPPLATVFLRPIGPDSTPPRTTRSARASAAVSPRASHSSQSPTREVSHDTRTSEASASRRSTS
jgi:1,4-alpha-glucan branching enzyme